MPKPWRARILIADDHAFVAEGIARLVGEHHEVMGIVPNGRLLLEEAERLKPDLVCLDISMPEMNGLEAALQLARRSPRTKVLFITQQLGLPYLKAAFRAGARGYVAKQSASHEIERAVTEVLAGRRYVTPLITEDQYEPGDLDKKLESVFTDALTDRQRQVLQLLAEGHTTRSISDVMKLSPKTVEYHKTNLMNELGLHSIAELIRYALAQRIVG